MDMEQSIDYFNNVQGSINTPSMAAMYHPGTLRQLPIYTVPLISAQLIPINAVTNPEGILMRTNALDSIPVSDEKINEIYQSILEGCKNSMKAELEMCGGGGKSKIQKGGASATGALAWGITAAIISGTTFAAVSGWGAAEHILAGAWFLPKLCDGTEIMLTAFGLGPRGTQSCAARANRYAWLAKMLATLFLTSGSAIATQFNPVRIQQWVKGKLDNFYTFLQDRGKVNEQCENPQVELNLMNEWLSTQDPKFYSAIKIDSNAPINPQVRETMDAIVVAAVNAANEDAKKAAASADALTAASAPSSQTWNEYWKNIVEKVNASRAGGKRRRRTRHRKNKNLKNKKSKRKMPKRKASKRRRNKRNKTRR